MQVVRAGSRGTTREPAPLAADWLRGPHQDDALDVALVHFAPGAATPPHVHHGGQVLVVTAGMGFVEVGGVVTDLMPGDIVVTPAGEEHVHGAAAGGSFSHLSVTTGRNEMLVGGVDYPGSPAATDEPGA